MFIVVITIMEDKLVGVINVRDNKRIMYTEHEECVQLNSP